MSRKKRNDGGGGGGGGHDGGGALRWLLTYADMITLLMAFFIMMYSMSVLNLAKFNAVAFSIRSGFGGVLKGGSSLFEYPAGQLSVQTRSPKREQRSLTEVKVAVEAYVSATDLGEAVEVTRDERGVVIRIAAENLLFRRGTAELAPKAPEVLSRIAEFIMPLDNEILVEGFTCDLPIATAQYPSNWELSGGRASRVVRFLEARGVPGRRLSAVGHGEMRPRFRNDTETHRRKNRRVDIVILDTAIPVGKIWSAPSPGHEAQPGEKHVRPMLPKVWRHGEEEGY